LGGLATACGDTETKPADVTVLKLKTPMSLSAVPYTGTVGLSWFANNSEDDFSGYNVYVAEMSPTDVVTAFGNAARDPITDALPPIVFRDAQGDEIPNVRAILSKFFNWDAAAKANKAGDGENFAPYVRCNVEDNDKEGPCVSVKTKSDIEDKRANGVVSFEFEEGVLSPAKTYAVFVAATRDDGEEIASPTSNVIIVRPHVAVSPGSDTFFGQITASATQAVAGLSLDGGKVTKATATFPEATGFCVAKETTASAKSVDVMFQILGQGDFRKPYITGVNGARVASLGPVIGFDGKVVEENLLESDQRDEGQVLLPRVDAKPSASAPEDDDLGAGGGYGRCGQSRLLQPANLYAVAIPDGEGWNYAVIESPSKAADLDDPTKYRIVVGTDGERRL
jgi:hypothetical protein